MKVKVDRWDEARAEQELRTRHAAAVAYRRSLFEGEWKKLEEYLFSVRYQTEESFSFNSLTEVMAYVRSSSENASIHLPQVVKNLRFLHSQMSANPPSAVVEPETEDDSAHRAALAGQHLAEYGRIKYSFQERQDIAALSTLALGTGITRHSFDVTLGNVISYDEKTKIAEAEGDNYSRDISLWDFWFNSNAKCQDDIFETWLEHRMPLDRACQLFPDKRETLEKYIIEPGSNDPQEWGEMSGNEIIRDSVAATQSAVARPKEVRFLEYHQKGDLFNGGVGYHCYHLPDGTLLSKLTANPEPDAMLPYAIMTDIDLPGHVYGRSTAHYALPLMKIVDNLDTMVFDNVETHGNIKVLVYDAAEINEEDLNSNPVEFIRVKGTAQQSPTHLSPPPMTMDIYKLRENLKREIDEIMGINEVVQGNFKKDMSGFSAQTAINAANLVRRRLYNKYTSYVKRLNELMLFNMREKWTEKRKIRITGAAGKNYVKAYSGEDIKEGWTLRVTYGESFSLDPATRREEILQSKEILTEAGVSPIKIAQAIRFNEIGWLYDETEISKQRQLDIFEEMKAIWDKTEKAVNLPADEMRVAKHDQMAVAAKDFFMTQQFLDYPKPLRDAMYAHYDDRVKLAALDAQGKPTTLEEVRKTFPEGTGVGGAPAAPGAEGAAPAGPGGAPAAGPMAAAPAAQPPVDMSAVQAAGVVV